MNEKTETLLQYARMKDDARAAVIDTGCFNNFVRAYCVIAMRRAGLDDDAIRATEDELRATLDDLRALDALRRWAQLDTTE